MTDDKFLSAIDSIYGATTNSNQWTDALRLIAEVTGARGALFLAADLDRMKTLIHGSTGIGSEALSEYEAHWAYADPRAQVLLVRPAGTTMSDADMFTERQFSSHPYYEWLKRWDFRHAVASNLERHGRISSWLSVQYAIDHGPPTRDEIRAFERIVPHIRRAAGISARLLSGEAERRSLSGTLGALNIPVVLVTRGMHVVFANELAEPLFAEGTLSRHPVDGLQGVDAENTRALRRLVFEASIAISPDASPPPRATAFRRAGSKPPLVVNVLPIPQQPADLTPGAVAALFFGDPEHAPDAKRIIAALRALYPLTQAEAEIVAGLATGDSVEGLALRRNSTPATVTLQIKSALRKTSAENRAELIRLAIGAATALAR